MAVRNSIRDEIEIYNPGGRRRRTHGGMLSRSRTVGYDEPISIATSLVSMVSVSMGLVHPQFLPPWPPFTLSVVSSPPPPPTNERNYSQLPGKAHRVCSPRHSVNLSDYRYRDFSPPLLLLFTGFSHFPPLLLLSLREI